MKKDLSTYKYKIIGWTRFLRDSKRLEISVTHHINFEYSIPYTQRKVSQQFNFSFELLTKEFIEEVDDFIQHLNKIENVNLKKLSTYIEDAEEEFKG